MTASRIVVVGAGVGGLAAAIRLQVAGYAVTLVEKRAQLGGRAAQLKIDGYTFDMGPSIITAPHLLHDLWSTADARLDDVVDLVPLTPYYRIYFGDGRYFDYGGTPEQVEAQVRAFDPTAVDGYRRFMATTQHIYQRAFEDLAGQPFHKLTTFLKLVPELLRLNAAQSVYDFVSRFFRDPQLRTVFSFHPLFIGGNPFRASAIYSIVPYLERQGGVWFARGGMYSLVEAMHRLFTRLGGQTRLSTGVQEVLVDDTSRRATGVLLDNGESLDAVGVVLNADVGTAYMQLVPQRYRRTMTDKRMRGYRYSMSCFLLYLGLDRQYPQLRHHTIVMAPRYRGLIRDIFDGQGLPPDMSLYLHAPSKTDPSMAPPGGESLYVLAPVPHLGHGVDWACEAQPFRDRIMQFLENDFGLTGLAESIRVERRFTPLDFRDDLSSFLGSAFRSSRRSVCPATSFPSVHTRSMPYPGGTSTPRRWPISASRSVSRVCACRYTPVSTPCCRHPTSALSKPLGLTSSITPVSCTRSTWTRATRSWCMSAAPTPIKRPRSSGGVPPSDTCRIACGRAWCWKMTSGSLVRRMSSPLRMRPCVPVVLDVLHHRVYAGPGADDTLPDLMRQAARTWQSVRDGVAKIHYSSQADGLRAGAHAEYVDPVEFSEFLSLAPADVEFDCMLEAKAKDLALFRVRDALGISA